MSEKAFMFSLDATLCFIIAAIIIIATFISVAGTKPDQSELLILQKEHDLLKHWLKTRASEDEMIEQASTLLSNESFAIEINGQSVFNSGNTTGKKAVSSLAFIFDDELNVRKVKLTVFK